MVSRIDLGPDGGPYVEIDESTGELVIRVPNDNVDFDASDLSNISTATVDALTTATSGYTLDEDAGDLVVRDTNGTVALRRTDGGSWSLEGNDLNSVNTASVSALEAGDIDVNGTLSDDVNNPNNLIGYSNNIYDTIIAQNSQQITADNTSQELSDLFVSGGEGAREGVITVMGADDNDLATGFTDVIKQAEGDKLQVDTGPGTAGARAYSYAEGTLSIAIDDGSATYDVSIHYRGGRSK